MEPFLFRATIHFTTCLFLIQITLKRTAKTLIKPSTCDKLQKVVTGYQKILIGIHHNEILDS